MHFLLINLSSKNGNQIFQSLNHVDLHLKSRFLIKNGYHSANSALQRVLSAQCNYSLQLLNEYLMSNTWYILYSNFSQFVDFRTNFFDMLQSHSIQVTKNVSKHIFVNWNSNTQVDTKCTVWTVIDLQDIYLSKNIIDVLNGMI